MAGVRRETHYNTPEQVRGYLRDALAIVDELDPAEDLRQVAFAKACDWLQGKHIEIEQVVPGGVNMAIPRGRG